VKELVGWLLQGTDGPNGPGTSWGPIEIETGIADGVRRDIKPAKPIPVTFVYLTGYATPDGKVHFRDDIYNLDTPAAAAEPAATGALPPATGTGAAPSGTKPEAARPAGITPAEVKPADVKPAAAKPDVAKPNAAKPAAAKPIAAKGAATRIVTAKPFVAKPSVTKPPVLEPVDPGR
jgi:hypothetical protein